MDFAIGITTYNRPDVLEFTLSQFDKFGGDIIIIDDHSDGGCSNRCIRNSERLGIAKNKNKCLSLLKDYEKIFLFDDDCFPIRDKWWEIYDGEHHFVHADCPPQWVNKYDGKNAWWTGAMGCCMMVDGEVLRVAGGMVTEFGMYGYEHVEYTNRIHKMGITPYPYITPKNVHDYIWAMDSRGGFDGFDWKGGHKNGNWTGSSISQADKDKWIQRNGILYNKLAGNTNFVPYDSTN